MEEGVYTVFIADWLPSRMRNISSLVGILVVVAWWTVGSGCAVRSVDQRKTSAVVIPLGSCNGSVLA